MRPAACSRIRFTMPTTHLYSVGYRNRSAVKSRTGIARQVDRIGFGLLWLFVFTVPWGDGLQESEGLAFSHWVGLLAFCAGAFNLALNLQIRRPSVIHYLLLAWVAWSALTYFWSVAPELTAGRISTYLQLLAMAWLIWELVRSHGRQLALLSAYVFGTVVSCCETISNALSGHAVAEMTSPGLSDSSPEQRFVAAGFNANEFALVLSVSLPIVLYLLTQTNRKVTQVLYCLQFVGAVIAILLTGSRSALFAAGVGLLMYFVVVVRIRGWYKYAAIAFVPLALTLAFVVVPKAVLTRFATIGAELTEGTLTKRTLIWNAGMETFRDHAIVGVGSGAFGSSVMNRLDVPYAAHNTFLSVAVELGAVGALIFLALLAELFSRAYRLPGPLRSLWLLLLATWCVGVFTTTWEQRKPTWFLFGMLAAQAGTVFTTQQKRKPLPYQHVPGKKVDGATLPASF